VLIADIGAPFRSLQSIAGCHPRARRAERASPATVVDAARVVNPFDHDRRDQRALAARRRSEHLGHGIHGKRR
jgi:hypothetical protein